jgi:hypothetical protein
MLVLCFTLWEVVGYVDCKWFLQDLWYRMTRAWCNCVTCAASNQQQWLLLVVMGSCFLYGVYLRYVTTSIHVHQLLICVLCSLGLLLFSLDLFEALHMPLCLGPRPSPAPPLQPPTNFAGVSECHAPLFALLLDEVLIVAIAALFASRCTFSKQKNILIMANGCSILQVSVHSQNRGRGFFF